MREDCYYAIETLYKFVIPSDVMFSVLVEERLKFKTPPTEMVFDAQRQAAAKLIERCEIRQVRSRRVKVLTRDGIEVSREVVRE